MSRKNIIWLVASVLVVALTVTIIAINPFEKEKDSEDDDGKKDDNSQVANPASIYCEEQGGELEIRIDEDGNQIGYCLFEDGSECEEWTFYEGECEGDEADYTIVITSPEQQAEVSSPLKIEGEASGNWFFEGEFPVKVVSESEEELGSGRVTSKGDWMTEEMVEFEGSLSFDASGHSSGYLVFNNANPSGLEENSEEVKMPIKFAGSSQESEKMTVKVFFNNNQKDPEMLDCSNVYAVDREIDKTVAVGRASLEELLKGPTSGEKSEGYLTNINDGVVIQSLVVENGVAKVDFNNQLQEGVGGSCKVTSIRSQIEETLKQFSTVDSVIISINGETEGILQP